MKRDLRKLTGVYCIRNTINGKRYIGSAAASFQARWTIHRSGLRRGVHHSARLQRAWNKYGADAFVFEILCICEREFCLQYEQSYIDHYRSADAVCGYNMIPTAGSTHGMAHSPETRAKISASKKGCVIAPEHLERLRKLSIGRKPSAETRAKMSAAQRGRKHTPESIEKSAAKRRGKNYNPEHIAALANKRRGAKLPREHVEKAAASRTGVRLSDAHKAAIRKGILKKFSDPEVRAKMQGPKSAAHCAAIAAGLRGKKHTAERRANIAKANLGRIHTAQARANMKAAQLLRRKRMRDAQRPLLVGLEATA